MTVRLVDQPETFQALLAEVAGAGLVALDTEAASFHRYHDRIYLVQLSTPTVTAVIDPLGVGDLSPIGGMLADPAIEKIFHDADYDLRLFDLQYGFRATSLFDTRVAAELLNEPGLSLAALLERHLDVRVDKRFQRADWSARPLSPEMLAYAANDTRYLVALRDLLKARLEETGRLVWAEEEFQQMALVRWAPDEDREPGWLRLKGAKALPPRQLAILREVHRWRVDVAARMDRAEFRVLGNEALFEIARVAPTTVEALGAIKGIGRETLERRGRDIVAAVRRAQRLKGDELPRVERPPRRPREPEIEARLARLKEARTAITERLGLPPGVVCPNSMLEAIARGAPASLQELGALPGMRRWQVETFGADLLAALQPG